MKKLKTFYKIGNKTYSFLYYGKIHKGKDEVLLDNQDNLLKKTSFNDVGYKVINFDKSLSHKKKNYKYYLDPKKFNLRIIRPSKNDFNPPHRDVYFDNHANGVNIYIPISGSNKKSSLPIFPRSHLINESKVSRTSLNSYFNGVKFSVPVIFKTIPSVKLLRPDPKKNQMMI